MFSSTIENIIVSILTAIAAWLWNKVRNSRILNRKADFFGLKPKAECIATMNQNPKSPNTMSYGDIQTLVEVVKLAEDISVELTVTPFSEFLEPAGSITEFCLGGPDSNERAKAHLTNFLRGVRFNPYMPNDEDNIAIVTQDQQFRYKKNDSEYSILARLYPDPKGYPIILICGQTARSNQGAAHYLIKNYDSSLRKKFGGKKQFCILLKLQSPVDYGYKSARLEKDLTDTAFNSF